MLDHGQYILGPEVAELESALAAYVGAKHCVACASGTEALLIALMALGVKPGDEVITTPFTFVATAEMIVLLGAKPVFVDVEADTCNIDAAPHRGAITPRTRAIMPVSLYGQPADMDEINAIAARHRLPVIEDAAQSFGADLQGPEELQPLDHRLHQLLSVQAARLLRRRRRALHRATRRSRQAMREIRVHGQSGRYRHTRIGVGGRMDSIQCAVVLAKLERFDWEIARRIEIGARYDALLAARAGGSRTCAGPARPHQRVCAVHGARREPRPRSSGS